MENKLFHLVALQSNRKNSQMITALLLITTNETVEESLENALEMKL